MKRFIQELAALMFLTAAVTLPAADAPVTLQENASSYTLANGLVTARVDKRSGDLVSLRYHDLELMGSGSGHAAGYWSHAPGRGSRLVDAVTINPATNNGARAEVSVKGYYQGTPLGEGPGGTAVADIEIRYTLGRGDAGVYTYSIFTHPAAYPSTSIGEARFAVKLNDKVFDYMTIDADRRKLMPTPADWDAGTQLNMKEARLLNTGIYKGQVEHKYDYSAVQFDIPAFGWSGTKARVGLWFVNPSIEYLSGGATKVELTGHLDNNPGAAPTLLNYWRGSHYGSSSCDAPQGDNWTKVIGPFLIYCNSGSSPEVMWKDALAKAAKEASAWPYDWVAGVSYPSVIERGTVTGQLVLDDPLAPVPKMSNILVGLAAPDYYVGRSTMVDWQLDAKHYEFWVRADKDGHFTIPNIRAGTYTLHAIADGVLGEYTRTGVVVSIGGKIDFGKLDWRPVLYGRQLWDIGVADRTAREFLHGDHYWQWGLYNDYPKDFPHDVNYIIGKSDYRKDWNYAEVPREGGGNTTWSVSFNLPEAPRGRAALRLAFAATSARNVQVTVNGKPAGSTGNLMDTATIRRDGIRGYWTERDVKFDASLMKSGDNVLKLTIPGGGVMNGVEYDYVRLELDDKSAP